MRDNVVPTAMADVDDADRARQIALRLLARAPRSRQQLYAALIARDVPDDVAQALMDRYVEVGMLDDAALAASLARTRHRERGRSRRAIAQELHRKGFDSDDVAAALAQISDDDEEKSARAVAVRHWRRLDHLDRPSRIRRVAGVLGRRGYSPSQAFRLVNQVEQADNA